MEQRRKQWCAQREMAARLRPHSDSPNRKEPSSPEHVLFAFDSAFQRSTETHLRPDCPARCGMQTPWPRSDPLSQNFWLGGQETVFLASSPGDSYAYESFSTISHWQGLYQDEMIILRCLFKKKKEVGVRTWIFLKQTKCP